MKSQAKTLFITTFLLLSSVITTSQATELTKENITAFLTQTAEDMNALDYDALEAKMGKDLIVVFQIRDKRFSAPLVMDVVRKNYLNMIKSTFERATYYDMAMSQPHIKITEDEAKFTAMQSEKIKMPDGEYTDRSRVQGIIKIEDGEMKYTRLLGELKMVSPLLN